MSRELTFGEASWVGDLWAEVSLTGGPDRVVHDDPDPNLTKRPVGFITAAARAEPPQRYLLGSVFTWPDLMDAARLLAAKTGRRQRVRHDGDDWLVTARPTPDTEEAAMVESSESPAVGRG